MNKFMKVLAASALVATVLVGCGKKDDGGSTTAAKYAKAGLGVVSSLNDQGQVNSTFVALGLDADGKIQYIDLDVAQSTPGSADGEYSQTKEERGSDYAMKGASAISKEWDEQAKAFEDYCIGKTPEEVAAIETEPYHGGVAPKAGTDLAAGCTIVIDDFLAAVDKAAKNVVEVTGADKITLGRTMANNADSKQVNTTLAMLVLDAEGKVVSAKIDVAQIYDNDGTKITDTKGERGTDYAMKGASGISKEWDEQAKAFEDYCVGKTPADIAKVETEPYHGGVAPKAGTDLAAGCTIVIDDFLTAISKAK